MPYRHLTLLVLALASCAPRTEAPTEYQKGAYRPTPTRPPAFSPTTDAPHTRKCLAARLYAQCATYLLHMDISLINSALRYDAAWSRGLDALVDTALKRMKQECEGRSGRTDLNDMVRKTMEEWMRMIRAGGVK